MPSCKTIKGKTTVSLYKREATRWRETANELLFVARNDAENRDMATESADAIETLLSIYGPEEDEDDLSPVTQDAATAGR